jgi:hypothetical protein
VGGSVLLSDSRGSTATSPSFAVHGWLDSLRGLGDVVGGMMRERFVVDLRGGPESWTACFLADRPKGRAPEIAGLARRLTPWEAVQRAAWESLAKTEGSVIPALRPLSLTHGGDIP